MGLWLSVVAFPKTPVPAVPNPELVPNKLIVLTVVPDVEQRKGGEGQCGSITADHTSCRFQMHD